MNKLIIIPLFLALSAKSADVPMSRLPHSTSTTSDFIVGVKGGSSKLFPAPYNTAEIGLLNAPLVKTNDTRNLNFSGNVSAPNFDGNGSGLSNLNASYITGTVNDITFTNGVISEYYRNSPQYNRVPLALGNLNPGVAYSGIYSPQYAGSMSAAGDFPARGNETWDGKRLPYFIISTRQSAGVTLDSCKISTVTNLTRLYTTNGYIQSWTNAGFRVAMLLEDGWVTNYRSANDGFLCWNTNRFPLGSWIIGTGGINATNLTYYERTNGLETFVMLYHTSMVPAPTNWITGGTTPRFSISYSSSSGNTEWDGAGANPFGGSEYIVSVNPESAQRDISAFYAQDISGVIFQHINLGNTAYYDQLARICGYASRYPILYNSDMILSVAGNSTWYGFYGREVSLRHATHPMFLGQMFATMGNWIPNFDNDFNTMITESNDGITPPVGSGTSGVAWIMSQVKWESLALTNMYGYTHPTFAGDAFAANTWIYNDWYAWASVNAFFNANPFLMGNSDGTFPSYPYTVSSGFTNIVKNQNFLKTLSDVTGLPPVCDSLSTNSSTWHRKMTDGSTLVLMENETTSPVALTINWQQLGLVSNTIASPVDVFTNSYLGLATNAFTWTVPATNAFLFKIPSQVLVNNSTNNGQIIWDSAQNSAWILGQNNMRVARIVGSSGSIIIGTNVTGTIGTTDTALQSVAPVNGFSLALYDSGGGLFRFSRDGTTGLLNLGGAQANVNTGIGIGTTGGDALFGRLFGGTTVMAPTNALSEWPTAPLTRGGFAIVNSNSFVYLLQSDPAGLTWTSTNKIGK